MKKNRKLTSNELAEVRERLHHYMSAEDLKRYFPDNADPNPIMKYNELANLNSIYDILPTDKSFKVILYENRHNVGHWTVISRNKDKIYYFDSYSNQPDGPLRYIKASMNRLLGQDEKYLSALLKPNRLMGRKLVVNKNRLQSVKNKSGTCGRWVILWLLCNLQFKMDLEEFEEFIDSWRKTLGLTRDELVSHWVT